jgi:hypothetical protein
MLYTLLYIASITSGPSYLGDYTTQQACQAVIRNIYSTRLYAVGQAKTPEIEKAVDIKMQYQKEYLCVPK